MSDAPAPFPRSDSERVAELEVRLGLRFLDRARALVALTHRSYTHEKPLDYPQDNERLEFLGDAVLDLAISQKLMERHPDLPEGELSKRRASVVNEATLAQVARGLGLGELIAVGRGEELTFGRDKPSLVADALEAVVAAVYLDHGMAGVLALTERIFSAAIAAVALGTLGTDYKTRMQELVQGRHLGQPRYRVTLQSGPDHARLFEVDVSVRNAVMGQGKGNSKKEAEQEAAKAALARYAAEDAQSQAPVASAPAADPASGPPPGPFGRDPLEGA